MNNHVTESYQNPDNRRETRPWLVKAEFHGGYLGFDMA